MDYKNSSKFPLLFVLKPFAIGLSCLTINPFIQPLTVG